MHSTPTKPLPGDIDAFKFGESAVHKMVSPKTASPESMVQVRGVATIENVVAIEESGMPDLPESTYDMIRQGAAINPKAPALSFFLRTEEFDKPETWTYEDMFADITRTANFFHTLGIGRDDVVAFVLPNLPETHFTIWGGQAAGIVTAINPLLEGAAIADLLVASGAKVLVTLAPFPESDLWPKVQSILSDVKTLRHLVLVDLKDHVRGIKGVVAAVLQKREEFRLHGVRGVRAAVPSKINIHRFNRELKRHRSDRLVSGRQIQGNDFSSFFCTGGTTGLPKIAMRRHRNEVINAWSVGTLFGDSIDSSKTIFCGLPLFHVNAVQVTGLIPFSKGAHVVLGTPQGYRGPGVVSQFWKLVAHYQISFFSAVPTLISSLLQIPLASRDVSSLQYALCGAAPLPIEVLRTFEQRTGIKILEGYGLTEATCVSASNPPLGDTRAGSIGLRIPFQQMKPVVVDESGDFVRDCTVGEVGVIAICGQNVFAGYKVPEHNKGLWLDLGDGLRWLNTGDLGYVDADGYFYLTGRKKELIIRGGHNIDPLTIEEPLHRHPAVRLAAAVGRPDSHAGEVPVAYVELNPGMRANEAELLQFAASHIAERAAVPKAIKIISQIPLTAVGKIYKPALKELEIRDALNTALAQANISLSSMTIVNKAGSGISIKLSLVDSQHAEVARQVLGYYPYPVEIESSLAGKNTI